MKLLIILCLFCVSFIFGEDRIRQISANCESLRENQTAYNQCLDRHSRLALLAHPQVAPIYETCKAQNGSAAQIEECIWQQVPDSVKNELIAQLEQDNRRLRGDRSANNFESINLSTGSTYFQSTAGRELEKYLKRRLAEGLYGAANIECTNVNSGGATVEVCIPKSRSGEAARAVDRVTYFELYESQLSKNLIDGVASYCLEADPNNSFRVPETKSERDTLVEQNKRSLGDFSSSGTNQAGENFNSCFVQIPDNCYKASNSYSKTRACEVVNYMKQIRTELSATVAIKDQLTATANNGRSIFEANLYDNTESSGRQEINDLTAMSSSELDNRARFSQNVSQEVEQMKNCENGSENNCADFVASNADQSQDQELALEQAIRSRVYGEKLRNMGTEETRAYLASEGISGTSNMDEARLQNIREQIANRYQAERQAVVDRMNKLAGKDRYATGADVNNNTAASAVAQVRAEFEEQNGRLSDLVQYSNIVAGYLKICQAGDANCLSSRSTASTNTASIFRELEDLRNSSSSRMPAGNSASSDPNESARIQQLVRETERNVEAPTQNGSNISISRDVINQSLLKYDSN